MTAIQVDDVRKAYGSVLALDGLTLSVEAGTVFGFLGPNGAGKTTTIRILTGLARPSSGRAMVAGEPIRAGGRTPLWRIGYLPEEPVFYPWMTPCEFLDYVGGIFGQTGRERKARTEELLELVGLAGVKKRRIEGFSRGMRQRLGLAQAMVNKPDVLFLDEPVSALDPAGRREILELIRKTAGASTVFMSTHILADVERVCDTVGIIARGRLVTQAPRERLVERYALPVFEVEAADGDAPALARLVERLNQEPWITSVSIDGNRARFSVNDSEKARRELLAAALHAGLRVERFEALKPSLEDVFLKLTGKPIVGAEEVL